MPNNSVTSDSSQKQNNKSQIADKEKAIRQMFDCIFADQQPEKYTLSLHNVIQAELTDSKSLKSNEKPLPNLLCRFKEEHSKIPTNYFQALTNMVNLLDKLFEFILSDKHLLKPIKKQFTRLQLPFLKLAISDQNLFLEPQHTARMLLNEMAQTAILWDPNESKTQLIYDQIDKTTQKIVKDCFELCDKPYLNQLFQDAAGQFKQFSSGLKKRSAIFEKRIKEAEEGKAKAESAKKWADIALQTISQKKNLPDFVKTTFQEAWKHVVFLEHLKEGEKGEALNTAKSLLVSLQPINSILELEKFLALQPILIQSLKQGLEKTSFSFAETSAFFEELDITHNKILLDVQSSIKNSCNKEIIRLQPIEQSPTVSSTTEQPLSIDEMTLEQWTTHVFNNIPDDNPQQQSATSRQAQRHEKEQAANQKLLKFIQPGRWFDIDQNNSKVRCKLASYIEQNEKYIFVNANGIKVAELNRHQLVDALQKQQVILLDNTPIFERAFNTVVDKVIAEHLDIQKSRELEKREKQLQLEKEYLKKQKEKERIKNEKIKQEALAAKVAENLEVEKEVVDTTLQSTQSHAADPNEQDIANISRLAVGSWVEIKLGDDFKKCRLAARISSTGKFIFTDRSGIKVKESFASELASLYRSGQLKLEQKNDMFDQALASVISNMRNLKSDR